MSAPATSRSVQTHGSSAKLVFVRAFFSERLGRRVERIDRFDVVCNNIKMRGAEASVNAGIAVWKCLC
jgi:hypothetical protein